MGDKEKTNVRRNENNSRETKAIPQRNWQNQENN